MAILRIDTATPEEWQQERNKSIGGSDAAAVVGLNPYKGPFTLWAEKTGAVQPEDISHRESVRLGKFLEEYVAQRFSEETGKSVYKEPATLRNTAYPWAHANVDRLVAGEPAGLECKTTSEINLRKFRSGEYPATYYCQCVHYMAVTGMQKWYLAVLVGNREFLWYEIPRDRAEIDALMEAEKVFWQKVLAREAPDMDGTPAESSALDAMYSPDDGTEIDLTEYAETIRGYIALQKQVKSLKQSMDAAANAIKMALGKSGKGRAGDIRVSWNPYTSRRINTDKLRSQFPDIAKAVTTEVTSRRFCVEGE